MPYSLAYTVPAAQSNNSNVYAALPWCLIQQPLQQINLGAATHPLATVFRTCILARSPTECEAFKGVICRVESLLKEPKQLPRYVSLLPTTTSHKSSHQLTGAEPTLTSISYWQTKLAPLTPCCSTPHALPFIVPSTTMASAQVTK